MPMLDAYIPEGALSAQAEEKLLARLTDLLLEHEGADPTNETVRSIAWVFVHRVDVYVAGAPADAPRYRFVASVPEGQFNPERRQAIVEAITEAVLDAEEGSRPRDPNRVWVFPTEIPRARGAAPDASSGSPTSPASSSGPRRAASTPSGPLASAVAKRLRSHRNHDPGP